MRKRLNQLSMLVLAAGLWTCGPKNDVQPELPGYLVVPSTLTSYAGSGLVSIDGDLTLRAEGPERLNATTKTYSGVLGKISAGDLQASFTLGQPRIYSESRQVPGEYRANGALAVIRTVAPGTYPMNAQAPTPRGEFADLTLELPGPQIYLSQSGSLTISESTLIKSQGGESLYRIQGTFQAGLYGTGIGITPGKPINITGSFDLLLLKQ